MRSDPDAARSSVAGLPDEIWLDLAFTLAAMPGVFLVAALGQDLDLPRKAPILIARLVLGFTVAATIRSAVGGCPCARNPLTGNAFERLAPVLTALATLTLAAAAQSGRPAPARKA